MLFKPFSQGGNTSSKKKKTELQGARQYDRKHGHNNADLASPADALVLHRTPSIFAQVDNAHTTASSRRYDKCTD
jgi:hypothetical protein